MFEATMKRVRTESAEETFELGRQWAQLLKPNQVVCLSGDLGAGKTTFMKGLASAASGLSEHEINSPTFVYLNIYEGKQTVYHFDLYRMDSSEDFLSVGFDEYFSAGGICCIEWPERISDILPEDRIEITVEHLSEQSREITVTGMEV